MRPSPFQFKFQAAPGWFNNQHYCRQRILDQRIDPLAGRVANPVDLRSLAKTPQDGCFKVGQTAERMRGLSFDKARLVNVNVLHAVGKPDLAEDAINHFLGREQVASKRELAFAPRRFNELADCGLRSSSAANQSMHALEWRQPAAKLVAERTSSAVE